VGVVQGNVDAAQRWSQLFKEANYRKYARLSLSLADENPAVIVWPESAALSYLQIDRLYRERFRALADSLHTPIFTGALDFENDSTETGHSYNAAFLIRPGGAPLERYAKRQLVPFGEHNPLERTFPILQQVDFGQANFTPGPEATIFSVPSLKLTGGGDRPARFGALICFESIFPKLTRSFRDGNIDFLVIITNDGWFGELAAPYQHAAIAVYRAIESRRPVARCANTGISLFIDQAGRISQPSPTYEEHAMVARLETTEAVTLYARYGDLAPRVVLLVAGLGLLTLLIPGRRNGSGNQSAV